MDITGTETAINIIWANALGGHVRWHGCKHGHVHNAVTDAVIGSWQEYCNGHGYSINTYQYGGYADPDELVLDMACDD